MEALEQKESLVLPKEVVFTKRVRAGFRTYFFDVKETKGGDYYLTITESKKEKGVEDGKFTKHKLFLYKEDFAKFTEGLTEAVGYVAQHKEVIEKRPELIQASEVIAETPQQD